MSNTTFTLVFSAMMITIMLLHGCSSQKIYFRGECSNDRYTILGFTLSNLTACTLPTEEDMVELTGHPRGKMGERENSVIDIIANKVKDEIRGDKDE